MLDLKFIRANIELVRQAIANKNEKADLDKVLERDDKRRKLQFDFDNLTASQLVNRKQPCEPVLPISSGLGVPCMP